MVQERQDRSLCLVHTLNNLLQRDHFSKELLDDLAEELTPSKFGLFNPHKRAFLGDYDVVSGFWKSMLLSKTGLSCSTVALRQHAS